MENYKELYYELFNKISNVIEELKQIQINAEEKFISDENESVKK